MTVAEVRDEVEGIRALADGQTYGTGDAAAHIAEDVLHIAVLRAIAEGSARDPRAMAAAALETAGIEFDRWYE